MEQHMQELLTPNTVFVSPIGSRLYNLHDECSDYDYISVELIPRGKHSLIGDLDVKRTSLVNMMKTVQEKVSHTVLEAVFSQQKLLGEQAHYLPMLEGLRFPAVSMLKTFRRVAEETVLFARPEKEFKRLRLALYLASCVEQSFISPTGYYNPTVSDEKRLELTESAESLMPLSREDRIAVVMTEFERIAAERYDRM